MRRYGRRMSRPTRVSTGGLEGARTVAHMVGYAHLDPVWLWPCTEGYVEARATPRSAVDRLGEFPEFVYTGGPSGWRGSPAGGRAARRPDCRKAAARQQVRAIVEVYARTTIAAHAVDVDDTAFVLATHASGATSSLQVAWAAAGDGVAVNEAYGDAGTVAAGAVPAGVAEGRHVVEVLDAAYRSSLAGVPEAIRLTPLREQAA